MAPTKIIGTECDVCVLSTFALHPLLPAAAALAAAATRSRHGCLALQYGLASTASQPSPKLSRPLNIINASKNLLNMVSMPRSILITCMVFLKFLLNFESLNDA